MSIKTVIKDNKEKINKKLYSAKKQNKNWDPQWTIFPTYFCFQEQVLSLLDSTIDSNHFQNLDDLSEEQKKLVKTKVLTLLSLSLNFADLMDYNFEEWLEDEN